MRKRRTRAIIAKRPSAHRLVESGSKPTDQAAREEAVPHPLVKLQQQIGNAKTSRVIAQQRSQGEHTLNLPKVMRVLDPVALQRAVTKNFKDDLGRDKGSITLDAEAQLLRGANQLMGTVKFPNGVQELDAFNLNPASFKNFRGTLRLNIKATWNFRGGAPVSKCIGEGFLSIDTPFRIPGAKPGAKTDDDGAAVKFKQPRLARQESSGVCAGLDPQPEAKADADDTGLSLEASPRVTFQVQDASQLGLGPLQFQKQIAETSAFGADFTVNLLVEKAQPGPSPAPTPKQQLKRFQKKIFFGVDERNPPEDQLAALRKWWRGEDPDSPPAPNDDAKSAVQSGQTQVFVVGHASRTGSRAHNLVLAKDRSDNVSDFLLKDKEMMGAGANISSSSAGLDAATTPGEAESERFVEVVFEAQVSDGPPSKDSDKSPDTTTAD